ncbi:ComEC/Rec2 family competence protein [Undibacterium sp.]|uniref:ComEC/Rec2 family competence protein n=1 Tax=Undibacterium sp. TaxID=1914977 RepID=UPI00374DD3FB
MKPYTMNRRRFMLGMLAAPLSAMGGITVGAANAAISGIPKAGGQPGERLQPWTPGCMDIHHIATGRGNATFVLMPDGTSLLIDTGATADELDVSAAPRPSAERRPGEWIGRYVQRHLHDAGSQALDYMLVTHFHPDHTGDVTDNSPLSEHGYRLSGITDVAAIVPIGTLVDRGFPAYDYPAAPKGRFADNYLAYVQARLKQGLRVERFRTGSAAQFVPRGRHAVPPAGAAVIRNLAANGDVWTGNGENTRAMFPPLASLAAADYPNENVCSVAIRLSCGKFSYFTAGDLTSYTFDGDMPWRDVLTAAARAAGPVDVATADHHGMFDGLSADTVRTLRPQAWVIPAWHIAHPDMQQLERMLSERLYPGPRDIFATSIMHENFLANRRLVSRLRSTDGHIVVRVAPGGASFHIAVTDNTDEQDRIKLVTGPYASGRGTV